jgi:hypothetical protein
VREFSIVAPQCSLAFGAPGIAYSLTRAAELLDDSELLLAADSWITAAEQHASRKAAFISQAQQITRRKVGFASLAFAEPSLFYVASQQLVVSEFHLGVHHADFPFRATGSFLACIDFMSAADDAPSSDSP